MEVDASLIETFMTITGADIQVAKHYLEAHNNELNTAIDTYLEGAQHEHPVPGPARQVAEHPLTGCDDLDEEGDIPEQNADAESNDSFHTPRDFDSYPTDMDPSLMQPHGTGIVHPDLLSDLPEGFGRSDLEEAQMLESALLGVPFQGDYGQMVASRTQTVAAPPARTASPTTMAARELREQQDFEFEESQRADREKHEAAMREERLQREAAVVEERRKQEEQQCLMRILERKNASLCPEPLESDPNTITIIIRLPDGARCRRRFHKGSPLTILFDFVDVEVNKNNVQQQEGSDGASEKDSWWRLGGYDLAMHYPRRVLTESRLVTLADAGLTEKQETLFVELK